MERSQRRGIEERRSQRQASPWNHLLPRYKNRVGDGGSPDPERWEGRLNHSFRLSRESAAKQNRVGDGGSPGPGRWEGRLNHSFRLSRESAAKQNRVGDGGSPGPGRWEGRLNHSSRLNREPAAKQISPGRRGSQQQDLLCPLLKLSPFSKTFMVTGPSSLTVLRLAASGYRAVINHSGGGPL